MTWRKIPFDYGEKFFARINILEYSNSLYISFNIHIIRKLIFVKVLSNFFTVNYFSVTHVLLVNENDVQLVSTFGETLKVSKGFVHFSCCIYFAVLQCTQTNEKSKKLYNTFRFFMVLLNLRSRTQVTLCKHLHKRTIYLPLFPLTKASPYLFLS